MTKIITLLTGNKKKKEALEKAIEKFDIKLNVENPWLPEIQDEDTAKVAAFAAQYGANLLKKPVIKMDSGFYIEALNGFPGTLVSTVDKKIGAESFLGILKNLKNRKAWINDSLAYCEPDKEPVVFNSECNGFITDSPTLSEDTFIGRLFIPDHSENKEMKTLGQIRRENPALASKIWGGEGESTESQFVKWFIKFK